ncbi:MAG: SufE family protein, partial [Bacteroidales bacterium]
MSEVEEREKRFLDALAQLDDNVLQHEYILSFASCLDMLVPEECTDENALTGCTADAWLELREDGAGGIAMRGASDALIVRGLLGAVSEMIAGVPAADIARWHPRLFRE